MQHFHFIPVGDADPGKEGSFLSKTFVCSSPAESRLFFQRSRPFTWLLPESRAWETALESQSFQKQENWEVRPGQGWRHMIPGGREAESDRLDSKLNRTEIWLASVCCLNVVHPTCNIWAMTKLGIKLPFRCLNCPFMRWLIQIIVSERPWKSPQCRRCSRCIPNTGSCLGPLFPHLHRVTEDMVAASGYR